MEGETEVGTSPRDFCRRFSVQRVELIRVQSLVRRRRALLEYQQWYTAERQALIRVQALMRRWEARRLYQWWYDNVMPLIIGVQVCKV